MQPDEPIEHELLRNAVAAEVTVTSTDVSPTSTSDGYSTSSGPGRRRGRRLEVGAAEPCPRAPDSADQDTTGRTGTRRGLTGAQGGG